MRRLTRFRLDKNQKHVLYPYISASGLSLFSMDEFLVEILDMRVVIASIIAFPRWAVVLKTPEANAFISPGNCSSNIVFATQKEASEATELNRSAGKIAAQYGRVGLSSASITSVKEDRIFVDATIRVAETRCRMRPIMTS
jgi:hypothetical protein